jgi:hypothetical protein
MLMVFFISLHMPGILRVLAGMGKAFLYPLYFYPREQFKTRTRARGHKDKPIPSPYRVFTRGHTGNQCLLPSITRTLMSVALSSIVGERSRARRHSPRLGAREERAASCHIDFASSSSLMQHLFFLIYLHVLILGFQCSRGFM